MEDFWKNIIYAVHDKEVAEVMRIIDWSSSLEYKGKFHIENNISEQFTNAGIEISVDKTLSHYNYIC